jgi:hypothetical protein
MITSYDRLQPMDKQGDYPIKVLIMAPLIMVSLPTVSSFFSTRGCFLRGGRSPSSLSSLWMASSCEWLSPSVEWRHPGFLEFKLLRVQGTWDLTGHRSGLGRPAWAHLGPVRSPLSLLWVLMHLCTFPAQLAWFWRCHTRVQDGVSLRMKFCLLRFNRRGCSS